MKRLEHDEKLKSLAKVIVLNCFRNNTSLENLHCGVTPSSKSGNFDDVKVVSPYGEIEYGKLSRISDEEMKILMKECVNNVYTLLLGLFQTKGLPMGPLGFWEANNWDSPEKVDIFEKLILRNFK